MTIKKCNWKTDLQLAETFYALSKNNTLIATPIPDDAIDFQIVYRAEHDRRYTVSRIAGVYKGCKKIDANTLAVFIPLSRYFLGRGPLLRELYMHIPNNDFEGKIRNICVPADTKHFLWDGPTENDVVVATEIITATILKGNTGQSAYELAVENGFEGTEEEWLEWLRIPANIVQEPGDSEDAVMSQKSTTELATQTLTAANRYTDTQIAAIPDPDVDGKISAHNTSDTAHEDIRAAILAAMQKFADYYTKSETYTKAEVNEQIAELSTARFEVVETLPEVGETNVIYLLPKAPSEASNAYDEYIYLGGIWEIIGTTEIDLSQYATREWVQQIAAGIQQQIDTKVDKVAGKGLSTNDYTDLDKAEVASIGGKISTHNASQMAHEDIRTAILAAMQKFSDYYTKSETYTKAEVNEQIAELSTARFEVAETLPDVGETNVIYLLRQEAGSAYDEYIYLDGVWVVIGTTKIDLSQYATRKWVQEIIADLQQQIDTKIDATQSVLAHSDCSLEERVAHLEDLLVGVISGEVYVPKLSVKELGIWGKNNLNVTNPGAPTLPPDKIGQFYFDETSGAVYKSTGNASISDWKIL